MHRFPLIEIGNWKRAVFNWNCPLLCGISIKCKQMGIYTYFFVYHRKWCALNTFWSRIPFFFISSSKDIRFFLSWIIQMLSTQCRYILSQQIRSLFFVAINLIKHKKKIIFQMFLEVYGCMVYHCSARNSRAPINVIFINKFLPKLEIG